MPQERFRTAVELSGSLETPGFIEEGDFDGDGHVDLVFGDGLGPFSTFNGSFRSVQISWNRGGGDFTLPEPLLEFGTNRLDLDSADLNGDGHRDLVFLTTASRLEVWLNDGHGAFTVDVTRDASGYGNVQGIELLDVDRDGVSDIVLRYGVQAQLVSRFAGAWVRRDANGQLSDLSPLLTGNARTSQTLLVDIDGDGDLDVVGAMIISQQPFINRKLAWFENTHGFPVEASSMRPILDNTLRVNQVVAMDVDLDGDLDLAASVLSPSANGRVQVTLNLGGGAFAPGVEIAAGPGVSRQLQAVDVNGDGALDLAYVDESFPLNFDSYIQLNDGAGSFSTRERIRHGARPVARLVVVDLDGDALPEVLEATIQRHVQVRTWSSGVSVYRNLTASGGVGMDRFGPASDISESLGEGPIVVADFDQDEVGDLLVQRLGDPSYVAVKLNDGEGRFLEGRKLADMAAATGTVQQGATIGDIDGNGFVDVAFIEPAGAGTGVQNGAQIGAVFGDGMGQFSAVATLTTWPADTDFVELHDLDGDCHPDLIGARAGGTQIMFALNDGAGVFAPPVSLGAPFHTAGQFEVVDVDHDGVVDILTLADYRIRAFMGLGAGHFGPRSLLVKLPWDANAFATGDFDGDGRTDFAVLEKPRDWSPETCQVATFLSSSGGSFITPPVLSETSAASTRLRRFDADANGRDDLIGFGTNFSYEARFLESRSDGSFVADQEIDLGTRICHSVASLDVDQDGDIDLVIGAGPSAELNVVLNESLTDIGSTYCVFATPNSTGVVGEIKGYGGIEAFQQRLELTVVELPTHVAGMFLGSRSEAIILGIPGASGVLCLGSDIGRFAGPGQLQYSGPDGAFRLDLDLTAIPSPQGAMSVLPGDTWHFQAWHRDTDDAGQPTSNFSYALAITFR